MIVPEYAQRVALGKFNRELRTEPKEPKPKEPEPKNLVPYSVPDIEEPEPKFVFLYIIIIKNEYSVA